MVKNYKFHSRIPKYKNYLKNIAFGTAVLFAGYNVQAQVSSYTFAQSNGTYSELTSGTVLATATAATAAASLYNQEYNVTMPFAFNFNGANFNNIKVSSNGYVSFGGTDVATGSTPISGTEDWYGSVSAWGRSSNAAYISGAVAGNIKWDVVGTAPNREMVIQWSNFKPIYSTSTTVVYKNNFQIRLKETTNEIVTSYNPVGYEAGTSMVSGTAEIGLRGASNGDYNNRENAASIEFINSTPGTANTSTQAFNTLSTSVAGMPSSGLTYTWTPPTCFTPNFTTFTSTSNSMTVNWMAPIPAPNTYDIYYSTSNTPPTSSTIPLQTNITGTSATINSLNSAAWYFVWIRSNCGSGAPAAWSSVPLLVSTNCEVPVLTTNGTTVCSGTTATLTASTDPGANITWYDAATAGNQLGTGNSYTTSALTTSTNYWAAASTPVVTVGAINNSIGAKSSSSSATYGLYFTVHHDVKISSFDIYPTTSGGSGTILICNALDNSVIQTIPYTTTVSGGSTAQTIPLNVLLAPGKYVVRNGSTTPALYRNTVGASFPYTSYLLSITGQTFDDSLSTYYYFYYNWKISGLCESARQQVTATVDSACLGTSEISKKEEAKIYPNPFNDIINISDVSNVKSITVSDISGRTLRNIEKVSNTINLSDLSTGLYIINIQYKDGHNVSTKMIKK